MAVTSTRNIVVTYSAPVAASFQFPAASNPNAPGDMDILTLASGNNVITFPTGGAVVQGATIIPPVGNTNALTLKGTTADVGVSIHKTDPTSIAFDTTVTTQTSIVIVAASTTTGVRIVWT